MMLQDKHLKETEFKWSPSVCGSTECSSDTITQKKLLFEALVLDFKSITQLDVI